MRPHTCRARGALLAIAVSLCTGSAAAQTTFSIDYKGPTIGIPSPTPIVGGDILRAPANTSNQTTSLSDALEVIPCP